MSQYLHQQGRAGNENPYRLDGEEQRYRSTPDILDTANALIANNRNRIHKNLRSNLDRGGKSAHIERLIKIFCNFALSNGREMPLEKKSVKLSFSVISNRQFN